MYLCHPKYGVHYVLCFRSVQLQQLGSFRMNLLTLPRGHHQPLIYKMGSKYCRYDDWFAEVPQKSEVVWAKNTKKSMNAEGNDMAMQRE